MLKVTQLASSRATNELGSVWSRAQAPTMRDAEPRGEGVRGSQDERRYPPLPPPQTPLVQ